MGEIGSPRYSTLQQKLAQRAKSGGLKTMKITAKKTIKDENKVVVETREATVEYNFGDTLTDALELFGEDSVFSAFLSKVKIDAQGAVRRMLENNLDSDKITEAMSAWKPGEKLERIKDPVGNFKKHLASMSEEERDAMIAELLEG